MLFFERLTLFAGLFLLAVYGIGRLDGIFASRSAIQSIESRSGETATLPPSTPPNPLNADFLLWAPGRIAAYLSESRPGAMEPLGLLVVRRLGIKAPVFRGTGDLVLNRGVGWIEGTAFPGQPGNSGLAGHRDSFFRALKDAAIGDGIDFQSPTGLSRYLVDGIEIVSPEDVAVLRPRGPESITLVTCYPFYFEGSAPQRFVVHARREQQATTRAD